MIGLIVYGIKTQTHLNNIADNKKDFGEILRRDGVLGAICNDLYTQYIHFPPSPPQKPPKSDAAKDFSLEHLQSITCDNSWVDYGMNLKFTGRSAFARSVEDFLQKNLTSPPGSPEIPSESSSETTHTRTVKVAATLVYSSVSGSRKTVSMLQLKFKLKKVEEVPVIVLYLGFNTELKLT